MVFPIRIGYPETSEHKTWLYRRGGRGPEGVGMWSLFDSAGFPPRWRCGAWSPAHGWLHILSDLGIWSAYFVIPCVLAFYLVRRRGLPFRGVLVLFVVFILSCGLTHLMEAVIFWWPGYRLAGALKLFTASVSWLTVLALVRITPRVLTLRSAAELEAEITDRERAEAALRESEERFRLAFDHAATGMALVSPEGKWLQVNHSVCEMVGYSEAELLATDFQTLTHPDDLGADLDLAGQVLAGARPTYQLEKRYLHKGGAVVHVLLAVSLVRDARGEPLYFVSQIQDVTARKQAAEVIAASLREKDVLLKEIHHRVKNNLQIVSTLLDLQSGYTGDRAATEMFRESRGRVRSMALIHERLYQSNDAGRVDFGAYTRQLAQDLFRAYKVSAEAIVLAVEVDAPPIPLDVAIPCGLLLNELVSNSLKHAFPAGGGEIRIGLSAGPAGATVLRVADTGVGFPPGADFRTSPSFGLQLVNTLVAQLDGAVEFRTGPGTEFVVTFPSPEHPDRRRP